MASGVAFLIGLQTVAGPPSGPPVAPPSPFSTRETCADAADPDIILVCRRRQDDRYRLPLHQRGASGDRERGEMPDALSAITPHARCGPFVGERSCSKREAAEYGYGNGRDPVTLARRIVGRLVDPDAD